MNGQVRHILVIPSEEYVPAREPLAGIFQKNQLDALRRSVGYRLGVLSVRLQYSAPMYAKALAFKLARRHVDNELGALGVGQMLREFWRRAGRSGDCLSLDRVDGVDVVRCTGLYGLPPNPRWDHLSWTAAGLAGYRRYVEAFGTPDLIHAHNALHAGLLAARIRRRFGVPYVLTEHSSYYHQGLAPPSLAGAVRAAIAGASSHSVVSPALRASLERTMGPLPRPSHLLPNVLPARFEDAPAERTPTGGGFIVLCVGSFLAVKGQEHLIRAFATFRHRHPEAQLRLAGEGPQRPVMQALARELEIDDAVIFLGEITPDMVRDEMLRADVLALPSLFETFGVVVIEAMACGLPVLATRCGGPDEVVTPGAGWLVRPGDAGALAEGLVRAHAERRRIDRGRLREQSIARYGRAAFAQRAEQLYAAALNA